MPAHETASSSGTHRPITAIAVAMIALGVGVYLATGRESMTAMIPSFIGAPILACAIAARGSGRGALIGALVLAVLGAMGPLGRIIPTAMKGELSVGVPLISQLVFMALAAAVAVFAIAALRRPTA